MLPDVVRIHHCLATAIDGTSLVLNALLLYLIQRHSTLHMKAYKKILLLTCLGDLVLSTVVLFGQPYIYSYPGYVLIFSNGFFACRNALMDHIALTLWCAGLHSNLILVALQFIWRYQLIAQEKGSKFKPFRKRTLLLALPWCFGQACTAVWCFVVGSDDHEVQQMGLQMLQAGGWPTDDVMPPLPAVIPDTLLKWRLHNVFYLTTVTVGYVVIVWCQVQTMRHMRQYGSSYRRSTQRAHRDFNRTLLVLALAPLASLLPTVFMVGVTAAGGTLGNETAFTTLGMTSITLVNPIATIALVRPYRNAVQRAVLAYRSSVEPVTSSDEANVDSRPRTRGSII